MGPAQAFGYEPCNQRRNQRIQNRELHVHLASKLPSPAMSRTTILSLFGASVSLEVKLESRQEGTHRRQQIAQYMCLASSGTQE